MGALDFLKEFEGRAIDAASYKLLQRNFEMQEQNNALLKDKVTLLEDKIEALKEELRLLREENALLAAVAASASQQTSFKLLSGLAFKCNADGVYEEDPYCPNCKIVLSNPMADHYICPKCKYHKDADRHPRELVGRLNAKRQ